MSQGSRNTRKGHARFKRIHLTHQDDIFQPVRSATNDFVSNPNGIIILEQHAAALTAVIG